MECTGALQCSVLPIALGLVHPDGTADMDAFHFAADCVTQLGGTEIVHAAVHGHTGSACQRRHGPGDLVHNRVIYSAMQDVQRIAQPFLSGQMAFTEIPSNMVVFNSQRIAEIAALAIVFQNSVDQFLFCHSAVLLNITCQSIVTIFRGIGKGKSGKGIDDKGKTKAQIVIIEFLNRQCGLSFLRHHWGAHLRI